ncbi:MAG: hypothetical protein V3W04_00985 [Gammaproteobacteria bacterium]
MTSAQQRAELQRQILANCQRCLRLGRWLGFQAICIRHDKFNMQLGNTLIDPHNPNFNYGEFAIIKSQAAI